MCDDDKTKKTFRLIPRFLAPPPPPLLPLPPPPLPAIQFSPSISLLLGSPRLSRSYASSVACTLSTTALKTALHSVYTHLFLKGSRLGLAVRRLAGKLTDLGSIPLSALLSLQTLWSVDTVFVALPLRDWLSSLILLIRESLWR